MAGHYFEPPPPIIPINHPPYHQKLDTIVHHWWKWYRSQPQCFTHAHLVLHVYPLPLGVYNKQDNCKPTAQKHRDQLCLTHTPYVGSSVHKAAICLEPPDRTPTPYGGRLTWKLPGGTSLIAHLKDKNKIRHKKRWSQCMYMYYLLGYRLCGGSDDQLWKVWYGMVYLFFRDSTK